jgi:membrane-associated protease RseP (regulator of RpoE activity)
MRPKSIWYGASLFVALSLVTVSAAMSAANLKPNQPEHSNPGITQGPLGPVIYLDNPGHGTWLGLTVRDTNEATAKELKLPQVTGAIVVSVVPGSPAAKAGFQPNDVIMQFDGQRVRSVAQLHRLIEETPANRTVKVEISRQGKLKTLEAKIENRGPSALLEKPANPEYRIWIGPAYKLPPEQQPGPSLQPGPGWKALPLPPGNPKFKAWRGPEFVEPQEPQPEPFLEPVPRGKVIPLPPVMPKFYLGPLPNLKPQPLYPQEPFTEPGPQGKNRPFGRQQPARINALGISGQDLTPQLARIFEVKEGQGVLVTQVEKGGPASAAGLKAGDVIVRVGSQQVGTMAELQRVLQTRANGQHKITLGVIRNHAERQSSVLLNPKLPMSNPHGMWALPIMSMRNK